MNEFDGLFILALGGTFFAIIVNVLVWKSNRNMKEVQEN